MNELPTLVGDKVKLKHTAEVAPNARGIVIDVRGRSPSIRLESGATVEVTNEQITNFSLAARKAWQNMPSRNVGRPKGSRVCDRLSVTIRLDRALWQRFREAEDEGSVTDRTAALNRWIADGLDRVTPPRRKAS